MIFSTPRHRKWSLSKMYLFQWFGMMEIHFSKVLIVDGAAENRKMERIQLKVQDVLSIKIYTNIILIHGRIFHVFWFRKNFFCMIHFHKLFLCFLWESVKLLNLKRRLFHTHLKIIQTNSFHAFCNAQQLLHWVLICFRGMSKTITFSI